MREPRVPVLLKGLPLLAIGYVISPLDLIPDLLPIIGELDDLAIVLIAIEVFLHLCPQFAVTFHRAAIAQGRRYSPTPASGTVLDAEWHVSQ